MTINKEEEIFGMLNDFAPYLHSLKNEEVDKREMASKFSQRARVLVLETDCERVGFISFYCNDDKNHIAFISMIAVKPLFSKRGYGTLLLNQAISIAKLNGMKQIKLQVRKDNVKALSFTQKTDSA